MNEEEVKIAQEMERLLGFPIETREDLWNALICAEVAFGPSR